MLVDTFLCDVPTEFVPRLNHEHSAYIWADPQAVLKEARAAAADPVPGPRVEEPGDDPELDPEAAEAIADGVDRLKARIALFDAWRSFEHLDARSQSG